MGVGKVCSVRLAIAGTSVPGTLSVLPWPPLALKMVSVTRQRIRIGLRWTASYGSWPEASVSSWTLALGSALWKLTCVAWPAKCCTDGHRTGDPVGALWRRGP